MSTSNCINLRLFISSRSDSDVYRLTETIKCVASAASSISFALSPKLPTAECAVIITAGNSLFALNFGSDT